MRSTMIQLARGSSIIALILACGTCRADGPDFDIGVLLTINGDAVNGALETTAQINANPSQEEAILNRNVFALTRNSAAQLSVGIHRAGVVTDYTGSSDLRYESANCLTVSASGFMRVAPSGSCPSIDRAMLLVFLLDDLGNPITYNSFLFSIQ